jgi:hypothetical protein
MRDLTAFVQEEREKKVVKNLAHINSPPFSIFRPPSRLDAAANNDKRPHLRTIERR